MAGIPSFEVRVYIYMRMPVPAGTGKYPEEVIAAVPQNEKSVLCDNENILLIRLIRNHSPGVSRSVDDLLHRGFFGLNYLTSS